MTYQDFSSTDHRLDNLINMRFVRAYAKIRHHVMNPRGEGYSTPFLVGYIGEMDKQLADELQLPATTLVGRLVDLGRELCTEQDRQGRAE